MASDAVFRGLFDRRTVVLGSDVDDRAVTRVVSQLLLLATEDPAADIQLFLDSPRGSLASGLALHDAMNFVPCDVSTWAVGGVDLVGALLLSAGAKGKRYATPASLISLRHVPGPGGCVATDRHDHWTREVLRLIARQAGTSVAAVRADVASGATMAARDACCYGLVDRMAEAAPGGPQSN